MISKALFCLAVLAAPAGATKLKVTETRIRFEDAKTVWKVKAKVCNKTSGDSGAVFYELRLFQLAEPVSPTTTNYKIARWTDAALPPGQCQTQDLPVTVDTGAVPADEYHVVLWIGDGNEAGRKRYVSDAHYIKSGN